MPNAAIRVASFPDLPTVQFPITKSMPNPFILHTVCNQKLDNGNEAMPRACMQCTVCTVHSVWYRERK